MSTDQSTDSSTPLRASPKMSFGRWVTTLGWRHFVVILAVLVALLPITYIIDKKGYIVRRAIGPRDWNGTAALHLFEKLAAE